jgi:hypothetical protein
MKKIDESKRVEDEMVLVSFKLAPDLHAKLAKFAKFQKDESGKKLSAGQAARRLMLESLNKHDK